ncbi:MAG: carbohydrate ABC transporter permease [Bacteroidetes bacterium]|nr:carbohydrate ABC transporter permease [Bacteroidota bacterium]MCL5026355.1 carbohydrate ABC transporter permease [Chloroflexota bacterium]
MNSSSEIPVLVTAAPRVSLLSGARRKTIALAGLVVLAVGVTLVSLFPIYWMLVSAVRHPAVFFTPNPSLIPGPFTLEYFGRLFTATNFPRWYVNSFIVAVLATVITVFAASLMSYVLVRFPIPGLFFVLRLVLVGYMLPPMLLGIPLFAIFTSLGIDDTLLSLIISHISIGLPFGVWLLWGFFKTVPVEIEESALVDGATRLQALRHVLFPLAWPGMVTAGVFAFIVSWTDYTFALLLISSDANRTVPFGLATMMGAFEMRWGEILGGASLVAVPMLIVFAFISQYFIRGLTAGGVKG